MSEDACSNRCGGACRRRVAAVASCTDILQALLLVCVVGWVLDLPRRLFGVSFYTEQLLAVCLGFSLALSFINAKFPRQLDRLGRRRAVARHLRLYRACATRR